MDKILLETSLGEALDKLSILEIKVEKIGDKRKEDCKKEYNILYESLKQYIVQFPYHYRILKEINLTIWNLQENIHKDKDLTNTYGQILKENDRRFRLKKKINHISSSNLKEQKGYSKTKAFVYTHLGLGDHFWMNGAVRYLSTCYDEVMVVCKKNNELTVKSMYMDDPSITFYMIDDDVQLQPFTIKKYHLIDQGFDVYCCGYHTEKPNIYEFPHSFYDDMKIARSFRTTYFYVPTYVESIELYKKLDIDYILIHQNSSQKKVDLFNKLNDESILILDINENHYAKEDSYYSYAELVVNKPMLFYKDLIEHAKKIYCLESSFYCFASHLDLSNVEKKVCYLPYDNSASRLGVFESDIL